MRADLPSGTVTFVFTDIAGSTKLLHELGASAYADALADHRRVVRDAFGAEGGVEVDTQGDAFFYAFSTAPGAVRAAAAARDGLATGPIRVRMGIHTGTPHVTDEGYVGDDVHRAARIAAAAHGGQIVVSAATAALVDAAALRNLGEHRLKDLSAAERVFQLGDGEFPPLKSLHQTNLPVPATPFLGRQQEVEELASLLARDDVRLVTLTGAGGSGKTRLALQAAGAAADAFPGGVWWVPLAPLRDAELVLDAAAKALGATDDLELHIADRRLLVLFDNFEHVVGAASDVARLLERCPQLTVTVTSREPLRIAGEWEHAVDPLPVADAVALFESRARAARRDFVANGEVREICARLDNLPLAIELAAARVKVLSPSALLERLERRLPVLAGGARDAPERQRTLRATIEWSHELLSVEEQALFRRFSVFVGGADFDACEAVCDVDLDVVAALVDKSLLRQSDDRFWMLETIREYAFERLDATGERDDVERRHAAFFLALAEAAEPHLRAEVPSMGGPWFDKLEQERPNLLAAYESFESSGDDESLVRLVAGTSRYWANRGPFPAGRSMIQRALRVPVADPARRANIVIGASDFEFSDGESEVAQEHANEGIELARELGDRWLQAEATWFLAHAKAEVGAVDDARELVAEAIRLFHEAGDEASTIWATRSLADMHHALGDVEQARVLLEEGLARARALANRYVEAVVLGALGTIAVEQGEYDAALAMLHESTAIYQGLDHSLSKIMNLARTAQALASTGASHDAARLLGFVDTLLDELGSAPWATRLSADTRALLTEAVDAAALDAAYDEGQRMTLEGAIALALDRTAHR